MHTINAFLTFICLTIVDFPLSAVPRSKIITGSLQDWMAFGSEKLFVSPICEMWASWSPSDRWIYMKITYLGINFGQTHQKGFLTLNMRHALPIMEIWRLMPLKKSERELREVCYRYDIRTRIQTVFDFMLPSIHIDTLLLIPT